MDSSSPDCYSNLGGEDVVRDFQGQGWVEGCRKEEWGFLD